MSKYKNFTESLDEMNIADVVQGLQGGCGGQCGGQCGGHGPIQPQDNVGEFGANPSIQRVELSKEEDGSIKIKTDAICVKLHPPVILALKKFLEMEGTV